MTAQQQNHQRRVLLAVASLSAGLLATALAVYTQADPLAFTSEPSLAMNSGTATEETADSPGLQYLPRVDGAAVSELAELDLPPMTIVGGHSHPRLARAKLESKPTCVEHWRTLDSGPVGRHVLITCPGAQNAPPPPVSTLSSSGKLRLPTVASFNEQLPAMQLPADLIPSAERAELAAARVDATLDRRWDGARGYTAGGPQEIPTLPVQNPFSWAPTQARAS